MEEPPPRRHRPPPHRCHVVSVSPRLVRVARCPPLDLLVLVPQVAPPWSRRRAAGACAAAGVPGAVTAPWVRTRGAVGLGAVGRLWLMGRANSPWPRGKIDPPQFPHFQLYFLVLMFQKLYKLLKHIENTIKLKK
jgi:hypothetical protein